MKMKPSDLEGVHPWSCVYSTAEHEGVANNIIKLMVETGDQWREVSWEEYDRRYLKRIWEDLTKQVKWYHRKHEKEYIEDRREQARTDYYYNMNFFMDVVGYTKNPKKASKFSKTWKERIKWYK
jgi:hypothetical protein